MGISTEFETFKLSSLDKVYFDKDAGALNTKKLTCLKLASNLCPDRTYRQCHTCIFAGQDHEKFKSYLKYRKFSPVNTLRNGNAGTVLETRGFTPDSTKFIFISHVSGKGEILIGRGYTLRK